jgi:hypothetical protein
MNVEFLYDAAKSHSGIAFTKNQVYLLTSNRIFEVKKCTNQIFIYKYNATGSRYEQGMWALEKDLPSLHRKTLTLLGTLLPVWIASASRSPTQKMSLFWKRPHWIPGHELQLLHP